MATTFAIETYWVTNDPREQIQTPLWIVYMEVILLVIIIADWFCFLFLSENRILYLFNFQSFISYVTVIPILLQKFDVLTDEQIIEDFYFKFWKVLRIFSLFRLIKVFTRKNLPMARVWFKLIYYIFNIIFVFAAGMLIVENTAFIKGMREEIEARKDPDYEWDEGALENMSLYRFHDMLYYMIVTITTVGYGDISP
jgi:hypothetical protein